MPTYNVVEGDGIRLDFSNRPFLNDIPVIGASPHSQNGARICEIHAFDIRGVSTSIGANLRIGSCPFRHAAGDDTHSPYEKLHSRITAVQDPNLPMVPEIASSSLVKESPALRAL